MDELKLVIPTIEYEEQIRSYREEFMINGDSMDGTSSLRKFEAPSEWLLWIEKMSRKETCSSDWVPATQYLCIRVSDNRIVGMVDIRHELNDYCRQFAGHIGYSIRKSERNKGYAKEQLRLALKECIKMGMKRVMIACDKNNEASRRTILAVQGVYDGEALDDKDGTMTERYWVELVSATKGADDYIS